MARVGFEPTLRRSQSRRSTHLTTLPKIDENDKNGKLIKRTFKTIIKTARK